MRRRECVTLPTMLGKWTPRAILVLLWLMLPMGHVAAQDDRTRFIDGCLNAEPSVSQHCDNFIAGYIVGFRSASVSVSAFLTARQNVPMPDFFTRAAGLCIPRDTPHFILADKVRLYLAENRNSFLPETIEYIVYRAWERDYACEPSIPRR